MKHFWIARILLPLAFPLAFTAGQAQKILTESEVVDVAVKNSASIESSDLQVQQSRYLQRSGFNLPNPEVIAESPTGEFYAVGILQSMEFPSVYFKQNKLNKQLTRLSEKQKEITRQDVNNLVRSLYLNFQLAEALRQQLEIQDSLYAEIARSAQRQFDAGVIDYLVKTYALAQAGEIHNQLIQTREEYSVVLNQLKNYMGVTEDFRPTPLQRSKIEGEVLTLDSTSLSSNPSVQYYQQLKNVNQQALSLERNKALPGIVFGYLNQGARETDTYYRFRVGVTLPLWFWQYSGNIKAAKAGVKIAEQDARAQRQSLSSEMHQALGDLKKFSQSLNYYETAGTTQADQIIDAATRFYRSGQTNYTEYLRNINEAYLIKARYLEAIRNYNQSVMIINYLTGKL